MADLSFLFLDPKGFFISTKLRGSSSHFRFDHFYIVDFHSALTFPDRDLQSEGWVKIYSVKMFKTEMARGPPKLCRNQKSCWIHSNKPQGWWLAGSANLFLKKSVFLKHPNWRALTLTLLVYNIMVGPIDWTPGIPGFNKNTKLVKFLKI